MHIFLKRKTVSTILVVCLLCNCLGYYAYAGALPASQAISKPPLLKYLSINSANPHNYFNFLIDTGEQSKEQYRAIRESPLHKETKKIVNYFFLGLTLPKNSFWVNLKPTEPDRVTSSELSKTDMGKVLLEQDLLLKKDTAKYLHPKNFKGKEFWQKLYQAIGKEQAKKAKIITSNRVWIVPDKAIVVETETGALITEAKLKVLAEEDYFGGDKSVGDGHARPSNQDINKTASNLIREIIIPELTFDVNNLPKYAPLRQIYHSLILAEYYKKGHSKSKSTYSKVINQSQTQGLESQHPWSKDKIWQQYLKSYKDGEYKLKHKFSGINRMYFSGGVIFYGPKYSIENIKIIKTSSSLSKVYTPSSVSSPMTLVITDTQPDKPHDTKVILPQADLPNRSSSAIKKTVALPVSHKDDQISRAIRTMEEKRKKLTTEERKGLTQEIIDKLKELSDEVQIGVFDGIVNGLSAFVRKVEEETSLGLASAYFQKGEPASPYYDEHSLANNLARKLFHLGIKAVSDGSYEDKVKYAGLEDEIFGYKNWLKPREDDYVKSYSTAWLDLYLAVSSEKDPYYQAVDDLNRIMKIGVSVSDYDIIKVGHKYKLNSDQRIGHLIKLFHPTPENMINALTELGKVSYADNKRFIAVRGQLAWWARHAPYAEVRKAADMALTNLNNNLSNTLLEWSGLEGSKIEFEGEIADEDAIRNELTQTDILQRTLFVLHDVKLKSSEIEKVTIERQDKVGSTRMARVYPVSVTIKREGRDKTETFSNIGLRIDSQIANDCWGGMTYQGEGNITVRLLPLYGVIGNKLSTEQFISGDTFFDIFWSEDLNVDSELKSKLGEENVRMWIRLWDKMGGIIPFDMIRKNTVFSKAGGVYGKPYMVDVQFEHIELVTMASFLKELGVDKDRMEAIWDEFIQMHGKNEGEIRARRFFRQARDEMKATDLNKNTYGYLHALVDDFLSSKFDPAEAPARKAIAYYNEYDSPDRVTTNDLLNYARQAFEEVVARQDITSPRAWRKFIQERLGKEEPQIRERLGWLKVDALGNIPDTITFDEVERIAMGHDLDTADLLGLILPAKRQEWLAEMADLRIFNDLVKAEDLLAALVPIDGLYTSLKLKRSPQGVVRMFKLFAPVFFNLPDYLAEIMRKSIGEGDSRKTTMAKVVSAWLKKATGRKDLTSFVNNSDISDLELILGHLSMFNDKQIIDIFKQYPSPAQAISVMINKASKKASSSLNPQKSSSGVSKPKVSYVSSIEELNLTNKPILKAVWDAIVGTNLELYKFTAMFERITEEYGFIHNFDIDKLENIISFLDLNSKGSSIPYCLGFITSNLKWNKVENDTLARQRYKFNLLFLSAISLADISAREVFKGKNKQIIGKMSKEEYLLRKLAGSKWVRGEGRYDVEWRMIENQLNRLSLEEGKKRKLIESMEHLLFDIFPHKRINFHDEARNSYGNLVLPQIMILKEYRNKLDPEFLKSPGEYIEKQEIIIQQSGFIGDSGSIGHLQFVPSDGPVLPGEDIGKSRIFNLKVSDKQIYAKRINCLRVRSPEEEITIAQHLNSEFQSINSNFHAQQFIGIVYSQGSFYLLARGVPTPDTFSPEMFEEDAKVSEQITSVLKKEGVVDPDDSVRFRDIVVSRSKEGENKYTVVDYETLPYHGSEFLKGLLALASPLKEREAEAPLTLEKLRKKHERWADKELQTLLDKVELDKVIKEPEGILDEAFDDSSSPLNIKSVGGVDLSNIELLLEDEGYVRASSPVSLRVLCAAKYLERGWDSLSLLYVHEVMGLIRDKIVVEFEEYRDVFIEVLGRLKAKQVLDSQANEFFQIFFYAKK